MRTKSNQQTYMGQRTTCKHFVRGTIITTRVEKRPIMEQSPTASDGPLKANAMFLATQKRKKIGLGGDFFFSWVGLG